MTEINAILKNKTIAVSESRQLDVMAQLLERRGASVLRVPLISIHDAPDPEPIRHWLQAFIAKPPLHFIILTGEGLRRLLAFAKRDELYDDFVHTLAQVSLLCRGPKPNRVLREIGLETTIQASTPTTVGIIDTLAEMEINRSSIAVQLYGENPNLPLMDYLASRHVLISKVSPYIYADKLEESKVLALIESLQAGEVDVIVFTSQPQFKRLQQVAKNNALSDELVPALAKAKVAAVGPVVKEQLESAGLQVSIMPTRAFFMKPLVTEIMKAFTE